MHLSVRESLKTILESLIGITETMTMNLLTVNEQPQKVNFAGRQEKYISFFEERV
jgi:hypothetical protein